jgi:hypothetical protein
MPEAIVFGGRASVTTFRGTPLPPIFPQSIQNKGRTSKVLMNKDLARFGRKKQKVRERFRTFL